MKPALKILEVQRTWPGTLHLVFIFASALSGMAACRDGERLTRSHPRPLPAIPERDLLCEIKPGLIQG